VEVKLHAFLTSALDGGDWSASRPSRFTPKEIPHGIVLIGGLVGPRAGLNPVAKRGNTFPSPARNRTTVVQPVAYSLHWLCFTGCSQRVI